MTYPVITIDGPSGAGKGTLCRNLANALDYRLLDSGALYRIIGLEAFKAGLIPEDTKSTAVDSNADTQLDEERIAALTKQLDIEFVSDDTSNEIDIIVNGTNVAGEIRNETVGGYASKAAALPKVREALFDLQKNMANNSGLIADGRDMGTVVFPEADAKIFLIASAEARAERRVKQLKEAGQDADYATILQNIKDRDNRDENRQASPSKPATDALVIDSSEMSATEVYDTVKAFCQSKGICFSV